ncbi:MAG TPA: hypothetical protein VMF69_00930 [Gemmataceae bacterium]|nr:hypothetical protein [Gemmataceae bacterium]
MSIENRRQLENTRRKLQELEQLYTKKLHGSAASEHVRELTLRSLKKRINQFKEEMTRFEARVRSSAGETSVASDSEDRSDHRGGGEKP